MKLAVIGCGAMGNRRIRHLQQLQAGEVFGFDVRSDRRQEVNGKFGIRTLKSPHDLIQENPNAIFICVPPAFHEQYLNAAVEHGWHFMTEQPVAHTADGLGNLLSSVIEKGLITHVSSNNRFHFAVRKFKEIIKENTVGEILTGYVEVGEWLPDWHPYEPYTDYYPSKRSMGGGLDAICDIEWLLYLFGDIRKMACFAGKKSSLDIDTDDIVQILLEFQDGPQIFLHSDMIQRIASHKAKFIGEKGIIECDWVSRTVRRYDPKQRKWNIYEDDSDDSQWTTMKMKPGWEWVEAMYLEDTRVFIERLQNKDSSVDSLREGIKNLQLTLTALRCSKENRIWENPDL